MAGSVKDIQVSRDGAKVSILIQLSQQPASADAKTSPDGLTLDLDGVDLLKLQLDPPDGSLVSHVEAAGQRITLSGAAFSAPSTVIYRNAVLVEATLADPPLRGASLMPVKATAAAAAPLAAPATAAKPAVQPPAAKPALQPPAPPQPAAEPVAAHPAKNDGLQSKPTMVNPAPKLEPAADPAAYAGTAHLAGLNAQACAVALGDLQDDPWSTNALGNHALCLLDQGKMKEATNRLDQLAAFSPEDWRVSLGRALMAEKKGDASNAEIAFKAAAQLAPDETVRAAIADHFAKPAAH
ncbi:MAG TPA: hypothetical protein VGO52_05525 [Hyphomonadaceae bacterium]|jgi:hypothetical protein|nr:hypothetical protein [Hyphomonadaceae bacterium]